MIPIRNVYYMLTYAFKELRGTGYKHLKSEPFDHIADLMAAILVKGIAMQVKKGLGREYVNHTEMLSTLRDKVNVTESLKL
ncbi:hypothetical protein [Atopobacter phocae]|uniref:hypothetical protein n=1 Tax=Atopobacter phocae TaxID=136492 RepID=UPI0004711A1D|nr:hypothetical protein [Atopobacter phocae]